MYNNKTALRRHQKSARSVFIQTLATGLVLLTLFATYPTFAGEILPYHDRFKLRLGGFKVTKMSTELSFRQTGGIGGASVSFENTLDLPENVDVGKLSGFYRINRNQRIDFSFYDLNRSGVSTLPFDLDIGGVLYPTGTNVRATAASQFLNALWSYSFINDEEFEFGLGGGLYISKKNMSIEDVAAVLPTVKGGVTAPLPVFNFRGDWNMTRKWRMGVEQTIFLVDIGSLAGALSNFEWRIEHQTFNNLGFGAALNYFSSNAGLTANGNDAEINSRYNGLFVYLMAAL